MVSSRKFKDQSFKGRVSNHRIVAHLDIKIHFESSKLQSLEHCSRLKCPKIDMDKVSSMKCSVTTKSDHKQALSRMRAATERHDNERNQVRCYNRLLYQDLAFVGPASGQVLTPKGVNLQNKQTNKQKQQLSL